MPEAKITARQAAYRGLLRMRNDGAYSNILLNSLLSGLESQRERSFASQLFYGVLERELTLCHIIEEITGRPEKKLDNEVLISLELAIYQILWLDGVPDSAAVNESVQLIKNSGKKSAAGFVNGVLRGFLRNGKSFSIPDDPLERASFIYSMPLWILRLWERDYGNEAAVELAKNCLGRPPIQLRVNSLRTDRDKVIDMLKEDGLEAEPHPFLSNAITVKDTGALGNLKPIREGLCYVQDAASQLCAAAVEPTLNDTIFDLCSAPGGKSFTMAQIMEDKGKILAFDLHEHRTKLISDGAKRLGISCIESRRGDASVYDSSLGYADKVLCDVPCAGLGVIRRKPEIRRKTEKGISKLPEIQLSILNNAANYLKSGGVLVYSTCSLNKDENDKVAEAFLDNRSDFVPSPLPSIFDGFTDHPGESNTVTLMPQHGGFDGFFIARFTKRL